MKAIKYPAMIFLVSLLAYSCGQGAGNGKGNKAETTEEEVSGYTFENFLEDAKNIPLGATSISSIHEYLVLAKVDYFQDICNPPVNAAKYLDSYPFAAANLGVYFADLIYHTYGRATENTARTYDAIMELSAYLGIDKSLYEGLVARYDDTLIPSDSILIIWNNLMDESGKYSTEQEKIFLKSAILLGNNIEKWYIISSLIQTPFHREISPEDATLAKKELVYFMLDLEPRVVTLLDMFEAQKDQLGSVFILEELNNLREAAVAVNDNADKVLSLDAPGIMENPELNALHDQLAVIRDGIIKNY